MVVAVACSAQFECITDIVAACEKALKSVSDVFMRRFDLTRVHRVTAKSLKILEF